VKVGSEYEELKELNYENEDLEQQISVL